MPPNRNGLGVVTSCLVLACAVFSTIPEKTFAAAYGVNLLINGNAENGPYSPTGAPEPADPWTVSSAFTVINYGAPGGFPTAAQGPPDGMNQFFAGGDAATSTATQDIDVSGNAADIDAGKVVCDLSAWLGGFADHEDNATVTVTFKEANMTTFVTVTLGPVTATDRASQTKLLLRYFSLIVPTKTRLITVTLTMQRVSTVGPFNDGYADSLKLVLRGPAVVTNTADSGAGSLRDVIPRASFITFDPQVFAEAKGPQTITLQSELPFIPGTQTIVGPGANLLTVSRSSAAGVPKFRIFQVGAPYQGALFPPFVSISGLTLAKADVSKTGGALGGAISVGDANLALHGCVLTGNSADGYGALFGFNASVVLDGCTISDNSAPGNGAIGNDAFSSGSSTITITNCTISGNTTTEPGTYGPNVVNNQTDDPMATATINLISTTISGNTGGFHQVADSDPTKVTIHLQNTIIASTGANFTTGKGGVYVSQGFNLSNQNDVAILNGTGDRNNTNPMLGPLQDNGGTTPTHALLPGSPAIDKGNTSLTTDQRGFPRPIDDPASVSGGGNNSDIGAFEVQLITPTPTPSPTPTATPTAKPSPTSSATATSTPKPSPTPAHTPTATPTATASPTPSAAATPVTTLANISTRLRVQTGDNVLIAGFIITGTQPKKVIVRGIGPSLPFAGHLANPDAGAA